jgi:RNA-binding protein
MNSTDKKRLRVVAHALKPVVIIGQSGLTDAVLAETELALEYHQLIKVRIRAERDERKIISEKICTQTGAELIQSIGQIVVIYRFNPARQ